jgi:DNA-binding transcriptional LysR family regulator
MSKAARQLSVSNPVVSKAIADLEHTLGVRVLDRSPQGVEPTIYGRALLDRGLVAFDELRQALKHVEFLADPTSGEVRIGTSIAIATSFVSAVIARLARQYPGIVVHLLAVEPSIAYRALEERNVDLIVARMFGPLDEQHVRAEVLYEEPMVVVAGAKNSWTSRRRIDLAELVHEPWTMTPPDTPSGTLITEAFRAHGLSYPRTMVVTYTYPARRALVITGHFLTMVPAMVLRLPVKDSALRVLPVDLPTTRKPVAIITLRNRTLSPVAELFIKNARAMAKTLG